MTFQINQGLAGAELFSETMRKARRISSSLAAKLEERYAFFMSHEILKLKRH